MCDNVFVLVSDGLPVCLSICFQATRSAGVVAIVGLGTSDASLPVMDATIREIDIRGCMCNIFEYVPGCSMFSDFRWP